MDLVGAQVRHHRRVRKWSVRKLSEELDKVGMSMEAPVITNLELGRRGTVSVAELLAFGRVLRVAPLLLLFPVGRVDWIDVLPGVETSPWIALEWAELGGWIHDDGSVTIPGGNPVDLFRQHSQQVQTWSRASRLRAGDYELTEASATAIRSLRAEMRREDLTPPGLPAELRYLDEDVQQESKEGGTDGKSEDPSD